MGLVELRFLVEDFWGDFLGVPVSDPSERTEPARLDIWEGGLAEGGGGSGWSGCELARVGLGGSS